MDGSVTYNTNSLQTFDPLTRVGINTNQILHTDIPDSIAQMYIIANSNDSVVPDEEFPSKVISLRGTIHGSTQANLDDRIDIFKGYFATRNVNLDISYGSGTRRYTAMKSNSVGIERQDRALFAKYSVELLCKPFGFNTTASNLWTAKTGFTAATFSETPTITGNAPIQLPVFTITINAFTGTADYVQISNDENNQEILLFGLGLIATDIIVIDSNLRTVTVNGLEVDYIGTFITLEPGAASITYTDGFATRNVDVAGQYTPRWL